MLTAAVWVFSPLDYADAPTHICVCTYWSACVSVRLGVQRTGSCRGFHSHADHNAGLLLGVFTLQATTRVSPSHLGRFDPGPVPPEASRSGRGSQTGSAAVPYHLSDSACSVMPSGPVEAWTRSGAAEVLSFSATGDSCTALQAGSSFYRDPSNRTGFRGIGPFYEDVRWLLGTSVTSMF